MTTSVGGAKRERGRIERLPSGSLRVRVYAGVDPLTKRRNYLDETIPAGRDAEKVAAKVLTRLVNRVDEKRHPKTKAKVNRLMDRYVELLDVEYKTRVTYVGYIDNHIRPLLGSLPVGKVDGEVLDSFYAELRRCRAHCKSRSLIDHRTDGKHVCDEHGGKRRCTSEDGDCKWCRRACKPHECRPLSDSTIRQIHWILSGAFKRAHRWRWVDTNPISETEPPPPPPPNPHAPEAEEVAQIITEAWNRDKAWGTHIWTETTSGARRGEICALRWSDQSVWMAPPDEPRKRVVPSHVNLAKGILVVRTSIAQVSGLCWEKETKTHQQRIIVLNEEDVAMLAEHYERCRADAAALGTTLAADAFVFSLSPDGSTPMLPDTVTQRYGRLARLLGFDDGHIHELRHYNATELIAAGVLIPTVASRLGHGSGGVTTLRVYNAARSEQAQRAAPAMSARMPARPGGSAAAAHSDAESLLRKVGDVLIDRALGLVDAETRTDEPTFLVVARTRHTPPLGDDGRANVRVLVNSAGWFVGPDVPGAELHRLATTDVDAETVAAHVHAIIIGAVQVGGTMPAIQAASGDIRSSARPARTGSALTSPYEQIADAFYEKIADGRIADGDKLPSIKQMAADAGVSVGTAHRAVELLKIWGVADVRTGHRTIARRPA